MQQKQAWEQMVTYLFFFSFSFPKCHFGQSAYYSNILLYIFCILNASPDAISWSHLLCTEEELAPACVARIAVQGREMINPQPVLAIPRERPLFPATRLVERQRVINQVLPIALGLSPFLPWFAWCVMAAAREGCWGTGGCSSSKHSFCHHLPVPNSACWALHCDCSSLLFCLQSILRH